MSRILLSLLFLTVLTGCHTITLHSVPENITATCAPDDVRTTPCTITVYPFMTKTMTLTSGEFDSLPLKLDYHSPEDMRIVLKRTFTIDSQPQNASVTLDDSQTLIGKTPCSVTLPADAGTTAFTIKLENHLDSHFTINPLKSDKNTKILLELNGPGRHYQELKNHAPFPYPVISASTIFSCPENEDSTDNATKIMFFPPDTFFFNMKPTAVPGQLLFTLFKGIQGRQNRRFRLLPKLALWNLNDSKPTFMDVTSSLDYAISGSIQPKTRELFYLSTRTGRLDIWKGPLEQDAKQNHKLFNTSGLVKTELDFSPAQNKLLFCATKPEDMDKEHAPQNIWILDTSSSSNTATALTRGHEALWSPDGKQIVFNFMDNIWRIDSDGSQLTRLTTTKKPVVNSNPSWSPDGKAIVFASNMDNDDPTNFDIWIMDTNGTNLRKLTHSRCRDDRPIFTSDGSAVLFRSNRCLRWGLWKIEVK